MFFLSTYAHSYHVIHSKNILFKDGISYNQQSMTELNGKYKVITANGHTLCKYESGKIINKVSEFSKENKIKSLYYIKNGVINGEYSSFYPNGVIKEKGSYLAGHKIDLWTEYYPNSNEKAVKTYKNSILIKTINYYPSPKNKKLKKSIQNYTNGLKSGEFINFYNEDNKISQTTHYKENLKNGGHKSYYKNGNIKLIANYSNDLLDGSMKEFYQDNSIKCLKTYIKGELTGEEKCFFKNGKVKVICNWSNGLRNGACNKFGENNKALEESKYLHGKLDGTQTHYDQDGNPTMKTEYKTGYLLKKQSFKKDKMILSINYKTIDNKSVKDGQFYEYDLKAIREIRGNYKEGKKHGEWKEFNHHKIRVIENYKNGTLDGPYSYYHNDHLKESGSYLMGKKHNEWKFYYYNLKGFEKVISSIFNYKNGFLDGKSIQFNEYGYKKSITNYKNGIKEGMYIKFHKDGKTINEKGLYKDGTKEGDWLTFDASGKKLRTIHY